MYVCVWLSYDHIRNFFHLNLSHPPTQPRSSTGQFFKTTKTQINFYVFCFPDSIPAIFFWKRRYFFFLLKSEETQKMFFKIFFLFGFSPHFCALIHMLFSLRHTQKTTSLLNMIQNYPNVWVCLFVGVYDLTLCNVFDKKMI